MAPLNHRGIGNTILSCAQEDRKLGLIYGIKTIPEARCYPPLTQMRSKLEPERSNLENYQKKKKKKKKHTLILTTRLALISCSLSKIFQILIFPVTPLNIPPFNKFITQVHYVPILHGTHFENHLLFLGDIFSQK
jgi:hypothetical protein